MRDEPSGMWAVRLIGADLPAFKGAGLPWDSDGTPPDPYLKLLVNGRVVWESPVQEDTFHPQWNVTLPRNVYMGSNSTFRLELWDRDSGSSDPAGSYTRKGLPESALPDAEARLSMGNGAGITVKLSAPQASRGVGLRYEIHGDGLLVLDVEPFSPAARAGLKKDDLIVAIGESRVERVGGEKAASELSLASDRGSTLTYKRAEKQATADIDKGFLWLTM
ncbi:MAG TPA: PDZ domain-containing protein [Polyangiales bacterium]|nr:PDZ domain-containing protein [Polyangiales bacterium]